MPSTVNTLEVPVRPYSACGPPAVPRSVSRVPLGCDGNTGSAGIRDEANARAFAGPEAAITLATATPVPASAKPSTERRLTERRVAGFGSGSGSGELASHMMSPAA